jgi:hypothetical protein
LPYYWQTGMYKMDHSNLSKALCKAELVLGDVSKTVDEMINREKPLETIGFISIDLDYYRSTKAALKILETSNFSMYLPRIFVYVDDIISSQFEYHCDYVGELLAIKEYNEEMAHRKICKVEHIAYSRKYPAIWNEKIYMCHLFDHPLYCKYIKPKQDQRIPYTIMP